tara:strand:+ start:413 stop:961 length:549 start_codon:yes stop_codon:yes gene_type:complete
MIKMSNEIDDSKWETKKSDLEEWFAVNPDQSDLAMIVRSMFALGDANPSTRKRYWNSIVGVFTDVANSPIGQGRKSLMDTATKSSFDLYLNETLFTALRDTVYPCVYATARTHGKSGGVLYNTLDDDATVFATDGVKKERLFLNSAYNAHANGDMTKKYHWDGSYDENGYPVVSFIGGDEEE